MTQPDKIIIFIVGVLVGAVIGYLVRMLSEMRQEIKALPHATDAEDGEMNIKYINSLLLLLIVAITAFAAIQAQNASNDLKESNEQNFISLCKSGEDNRNVQREIVEAIYGLATGAAARDPKAPPLTPSEVIQYNAYIQRTNKFRSDLYTKIQPSDACRPFVDDEDQEPPTDPFPTISPPKETPNG
jgi:heme/copper-type cytochrome/quinol oxidase subunit 2